MFWLLTRIRANIASLLLFLLLLITAQDCYSALRSPKPHHGGANYPSSASIDTQEHDIDFISNNNNKHNHKNNPPILHHPSSPAHNNQKPSFNADIPDASFESKFDIPREESAIKQKETPPRNPSPSSVQKYLPDCSSDEAIQSRNVFLISTLDGNLSAIDAIGGKMLWTSRIADTLLSSTISDFMVNAIGETVRIVPSLDGNLFVHNGKTIKQTQYSAEKLLKKSLKFTENVILVGGKESQALGIDLNTGKIIYECGLKGCSPGDNYTRENVIVMRRNFQSIRAVNVGSGAEDWHYQVNDPEVLTVSKPNCQGGTVHGKEDSQFRVDYKIIIPCGIIRTQVWRSNNSNTIEELSHNWRHKFGIPIVKLWHLKDGKVNNVDLFDQKIVDISDAAQKNDFEEPQLYIGSFKNQLYVQKSKHYRETVSQIQEDQSVLIKQDVLNEKNTAIIQVQWRPKLAIEGPVGEPEIPGGGEENHTLHEMATVSGFPFLAFNREDSTGYYVFRVKNKDEHCDRLPKTDNETSLNQLENEYADEPIHQIITIVLNNSLMDYWKEIICICVGSWFIFYNTWKIIKNYLRQKLLREQPGLTVAKGPISQKIEHEISVQTDTTSLSGYESNIVSAKADLPEVPESPPPVVPPFSSRFYEDFEPVSQLGKGGFGIVFEAKHKMDGRRYAVKRVAMPTKEEKKEKVKREVTFLANLEHPGIVRYYNAWTEAPPPGWQDDKDQEWSFEFSKMEADTNLDETESLLTETESRCRMGRSLTNTDGGDSLVSFRDEQSDILEQDEDEDEDDDNESVSRKAGDDITSGSESDDEEEPSTDGTKLDTQNSDAGSDLDIVFENSASAAKSKSSGPHVNWGVSAVNSKESDSGPKQRNRRISEKDADKKPKVKTFIYIQMELCKKITLKDWLMDHNLREQEKWLFIFKQILCAVDYVHEKKLIHRDLKPSNIFFAMDGTVKIGDFGLVTSILDDAAEEERTFSLTCDNGKNPPKNIKHTNEVGTSIYMSPEQLKRKSYNHKVDIFSIGIILYELLEMFNTDSERFRKLECVRNREFPGDFQEKYQDECKILHKLLSKNPEDRPEAREILLERMFNQGPAYPPIHQENLYNTVKFNSL